ncbi:MAG TPA: four helix bundle protein [Kiritimatiellia bacterium]|jgi:four helix bundle protein
MAAETSYDNSYAKSYRDLVVFQKAKAVSRELFVLTRNFPREEAFSLTDQLRRASRSVGAQLAEAWAKRRYEKHFVSKLTDADGEQNETQYWIEEAKDCGYLDQATAARLIEELPLIGRMLNGMILKARLFCQHDDRVVREASEVYIVRDLSDPNQVTDYRSQVT